MTPTERAAAIAEHIIATCRAVIAPLEGLPPAVPVVRVWRRRCRIARTRRGRGRLSVWPSLYRARGRSAAHLAASILGAVEVTSAQVEVARLLAAPPSQGDGVVIVVRRAAPTGEVRRG